MNGAALVAIAATIGNFLQGWDNATIAGAIVYIKKELQLGAAVEGLIVAMSALEPRSSLQGISTNSLIMLILSSMFYFLSGLIMLWSPNVYVLLLARLLDGFGIGLAVTLVPLYISETAPSEIRGLLNTLPQFTGSGGMFLAYLFYLPESPRWLVSKGKMLEAKRVLQNLRGREDVSDILSLTVADR
ncbi:UNVERIFIED_CONTAM: Monosaccharide-sensing protein 2 [Sesamum radiatum]|uniref:Monosaccharide-sensing protein 2 n=1 Tax=Sesamum radiatum TaxID=300843 RepID=A0AAW2M394_SESRA